MVRRKDRSCLSYITRQGDINRRSFHTLSYISIGVNYVASAAPIKGRIIGVPKRIVEGFDSSVQQNMSRAYPPITGSIVFKVREKILVVLEALPLAGHLPLGGRHIILWL